MLLTGSLKEVGVVTLEKIKLLNEALYVKFMEYVTEPKPFFLSV